LRAAQGADGAFVQRRARFAEAARVHLAKRGWHVTGVDIVDKAMDPAKQRAAQEDVEVQWVTGDATNLRELGLEPGYTLLYDFGCIHAEEWKNGAAGSSNTCELDWRQAAMPPIRLPRRTTSGHRVTVPACRPALLLTRGRRRPR
jgi:hypothetical protein